MKKKLRLATPALLLAGALWLGSCQREFEEVNSGNANNNPNNPSASFTATSNLAGLIRNVVSFDGSFDNIVDGSSCSALNFPYSVTANGIELALDSADDLQMIEDIFDEFYEDTDVLEIIFPVTVTRADYTEVEINDMDELEELAKDCLEGGQDADNECIDFSYPINLFTFDLNNTQTGKVTVRSDAEFRQFFNELGVTDILSLDYPLVVKSEKLYLENKRADNNEQLTAYLELSSCDEDDDLNFDDDDFFGWSPQACPLYVISMVREGIDLSDQYSGFTMTFYAGDDWWGESAYVELRDRYGNITYGEYAWFTPNEEGGLGLRLDFPQLVYFNLNWYANRIGENRIRLYDAEGNHMEVDSNCDIVGGVLNLSEALQECYWVIRRVQSQGEEIPRLLGYALEFENTGLVSLSDANFISKGAWEVVRGSVDGSILAISMEEEPGLSLEWNLQEFFSDHIRFADSEGAYELLMQRECDLRADPLVEQILQTLMRNGSWHVTTFTQGGEDLTDGLAGYSFSFGPENAVTVSTEAGPEKTGLWRVMRNSEGGISIFINLGGDNELLSGLTIAWTLLSINENLVELKDNSETGVWSRLVLER